MSRVTPDDRACTMGQARRALEAARVAGLEGVSRLNDALSREEVHAIFLGAVKDRADSQVLHGAGLIASNIRREFGVKGELKPRTRPRTRRRRFAPTWGAP